MGPQSTGSVGPMCTWEETSVVGKLQGIEADTRAGDVARLLQSLSGTHETLGLITGMS